jgi:hypothetical protein
MPNAWALMFTVRQGTEQAVREAFQNSGRPKHDIVGPDGTPKGRLLHTMVLMKDNVVIRMIEFEGELRDVIQHMRQQDEVIALEGELEKYLEVPRDMSTPQSAAEFFQRPTPNAQRLKEARRHG